MVHSSVKNYLHLIFATKNRESVIPLELETRLHDYFGGIAKKQNVPILKVNGTDDHIHMLIRLHPSVALSIMVKELKSYSTGWIKKERFKEFSWQEGYGAFSCSQTHLDALIKYIDNQKEHHKIYSFKDEIEKLNNMWGTTWLRD